MALFVIIAIALAAFLAFLILSQPDQFRVARAATINAPAAVVFEHINDLHKWQAWSPWARADPEAKGTFAGPESGVGASFHWEGPKTGVGTMTITDSRPHELVQFRLDFEKPFKATNTAELTLTPKGQQTVVSWSMFGRNNLTSKCMGLVINCEKMVGGQFDEGLGYLNEIVSEKKAA